MPIMRSPLITAEHLRPFVEGKVYCELGCSVGVVLEPVSKFAKSVVGIELDKNKVKTCREKGLNVIQGDVLNMELPIADVYYCWVTHTINRQIHKKIEKGLLIIGAEECVKEEVDLLNELNPHKRIRFLFDEGKGKREKGIFYLGLFYND